MPESIDLLPELTTLDDADLFPATDASSAASRKATWATLRNSLRSPEPRYDGTRPHALGHGLANGSNYSVTNNAYHYIPVIVENPITITEAWCMVQTAVGGGSVRCAIYDCDADDWTPGALLASSTTAFNVGTTGVKKITGLSWSITRGRRLLCFHVDTASGLILESNRVAPDDTARLLDMQPEGHGLVVTGAWGGSWPDPGTAWTTATAGVSYMSNALWWVLA